MNKKSVWAVKNNVRGYFLGNLFDTRKEARIAKDRLEKSYQTKNNYRVVKLIEG